MRVFKHHSGSVLLAYLFAIGLSAFAAPLNPKVVLVTNRGDITIELFYHEAPITVDNFLTYVNSEFYNGLIFHRVENRGYLGGTLDVIQGGACYYYNYNFYFPSTNDPIINESFNGLSNVRGTIAMARSATPNSATAQFYINHKDNIELDKENDPYGYGYCVFGRVIEGIDIVDTIASAPVVNLQSYNPQWPPYSYFPNPILGMYQVYVKGNEFSYDSDFTVDSVVNFSDFALFASNWLDDCSSGNDFCGGSDLNYSGEVDVVDLDIFLAHWNRMVGYEPQASDITTDGTVNSDDLMRFIENWLRSGCSGQNKFCQGADLNRSQTVDMEDLGLFCSNWLAGLE